MTIQERYQEVLQQDNNLFAAVLSLMREGFVFKTIIETIIKSDLESSDTVLFETHFALLASANELLELLPNEVKRIIVDESGRADSNYNYPLARQTILSLKQTLGPSLFFELLEQLKVDILRPNSETV